METNSRDSLHGKKKIEEHGGRELFTNGFSAAATAGGRKRRGIVRERVRGEERAAAEGLLSDCSSLFAAWLGFVSS